MVAFYYKDIDYRLHVLAERAVERGGAALAAYSNACYEFMSSWRNSLHMLLEELIDCIEYSDGTNTHYIVRSIGDYGFTEHTFNAAGQPVCSMSYTEHQVYAYAKCDAMDGVTLKNWLLGQAA